MVTPHASARRLSAALLACALAVAAVAAQAPATAQAAPRKGFIWQVERDGRIGWFVGSLHLLTADAYPLPDAMEKAYLRADTLIEEADPAELSTPAGTQQLLAKALLPQGQTLQSSVSKDTYKKISDKAAALGLPVESLQQFKPWMVAVTLVTLGLHRGGFDPALGIDKHFLDRAPRMGKKVRTLEGALEQIDMLERLGPELQDSLVKETLGGADTELAQVTRIAAAWRAGDAAEVERLMVDEMKDAPAIYQTLIVDRNNRWLPKLEECFSVSRCFVVVGAAHVVGRDGLVALFRAKGYTVTQQ